MIGLAISIINESMVCAKLMFKLAVQRRLTLATIPKKMAIPIAASTDVGRLRSA
jgi:hypothetical protein